MEPERFSPDPDPAFQVDQDPDPYLKLGQVSNWQILYLWYIIGLQLNFSSILDFLGKITNKYVNKDELDHLRGLI